MSKKRFSVWAILMTAILTLMVSIGVGVLVVRSLLGTRALTVLEGMTLIDQRFVADYDRDEAVDAAMTGMVDSLGDRWSHYLSPAQRAALEKVRQNAYVGIGITYLRTEDPPAMEIAEVKEGGPAQEAGLVPGERIVAVNGEELTEENFEDLAASVSGREGEKLTLAVLGTDGIRREVELTRRQIEDPPVEYALLEDGVGYVRLENFYQNAASSTQDAVEDLIKQGARGLLFDVRANPGGYVSELTELLDYLLPEGPIFAEHSKDGPTRVTQSDAACVDLPIAVLMDENSYSSAELFAAQLRESANAPLIGKQTVGKGYYQQGFVLPNGGMLNISTGMYTTGNGTSLIGVGLMPDYEVEEPSAQLDKAKEVLKEMIEKG